MLSPDNCKYGFLHNCPDPLPNPDLCVKINPIDCLTALLWGGHELPAGVLSTFVKNRKGDRASTLQQVKIECQQGRQAACNIFPEIACHEGDLEACQILFPQAAACTGGDLVSCQGVLHAHIRELGLSNTTSGVSISPATSHINESTTVKFPRAVRYWLLKEELFREMRGISCSLIQTTTVSDCTWTGYPTIIPELSSTELPVPLSLEQCAEMSLRLQFNDPQGQTHVLMNNAWNHFQYTLVGTPFNIYKGSKCRGEAWKNPLQDWVLFKAVVQVEAKILLRDVRYLQGPFGIQTLPQRESLPCPSSSGGCVTSTATHMWEQESDRCPLGQIGEVRGQEEVEEGKVIFTSTDGSALRIEVQPTLTSYCGHAVSNTNKADLFLSYIPPAAVTEGEHSTSGSFRPVDSRLNPVAERLQQLRMDYLLQPQAPSAQASLRPFSVETRVDRLLPRGERDIYSNSPHTIGLLQTARKDSVDPMSYRPTSSPEPPKLHSTPAPWANPLGYFREKIEE